MTSLDLEKFSPQKKKNQFVFSDCSQTYFHGPSGCGMQEFSSGSILSLKTSKIGQKSKCILLCEDLNFYGTLQTIIEKQSMGLGNPKQSPPTATKCTKIDLNRLKNKGTRHVFNLAFLPGYHY